MKRDRGLALTKFIHYQGVSEVNVAELVCLAEDNEGLVVCCSSEGQAGSAT